MRGGGRRADETMVVSSESQTTTFGVSGFMLNHVLDVLVSDAFLACLIPALLFASSLYFSGIPSLAELRRNVAEVITGRGHTALGHFSLERAALSYQQYAQLSLSELATMRKSYARISRAHKRVGYDLGYPAKLNRLQEAITVNARVTEGIVQLAQQQLHGELTRIGVDGRHTSIQGDLPRVRESLKHFVRDWSEEGRAERAQIFSPILDVLEEVGPAWREDMTVLVPGSGLGRLAWEISRLGE